MNYNVEERIANIRKEIFELNSSIAGSSDDEMVELNIKKKDPTFKPFVLKKFQTTLNYRSYKQKEKEALRTIDSQIKVNVSDISDIDKFMEETIEKDFVKKWTRLSRWQIKNRINKFVKKIALEKDLNNEQEKMLVKILLEMKLTLKNVKYENGEIIEITDFDKILEKIE